MRYFALICLIASVKVVTSDSDCSSSEWFRFWNKCYLFDATKRTFQEKFIFCSTHGATTVSIHSIEENNFLQTAISFPLSVALWLGIRQVDFDNKTYAWLDESLFDYNNFGRRDGHKTCAGAYILTGNGKWGDYDNCADKNHALCQIDLDVPSYMQMRLDLKHIKAVKIDVHVSCLVFAGLVLAIMGILILSIYAAMKRKQVLENRINLQNVVELEPESSNESTNDDASLLAMRS